MLTFAYRLADSRPISSEGMSHCNYVPIAESILDPGRAYLFGKTRQYRWEVLAEGVGSIWEVMNEKIGKIAAVV